VESGASLSSLASFPHDMLNQLQEKLELGRRLHDENVRLKRQVAELQIREARLLSYQNTCGEMVATQSELILSLNARTDIGESSA
jgi:hypothetical protein